jgi:hypothetical protein
MGRFPASLTASWTLCSANSRLEGDLRDAVITTTGPEAYRRTDGITVIPLALLGA